MYDAKKLYAAMAEQALNFYQLSLRAKVDPLTAKRVVTTGRGRPENVLRIAQVLGFKTLKSLVIPLESNERLVKKNGNGNGRKA